MCPGPRVRMCSAGGRELERGAGHSGQRTARWQRRDRHTFLSNALHVSSTDLIPFALCVSSWRGVCRGTRVPTAGLRSRWSRAQGRRACMSSAFEIRLHRAMVGCGDWCPALRCDVICVTDGLTHSLGWVTRCLENSFCVLGDPCTWDAGDAAVHRKSDPM